MTKTFVESAEFKTAVAQLKDYLLTAKKEQHKLLIIPHAGPDGDAIGSAYGMYLGLKSQGLNVSLACKDAVPANMDFLGCTDIFAQEFDETAFDTFVFVDCGDKHLTRFEKDKPRILAEDVFRINIDHHPTNDNFGAINFVHTTASSTCSIVTHIWQALGVNITPMMATALLLGIYTDTGGFVHQNTKPLTYTTAATLIERGGQVNKIAQNIFHSYDYKTLKLWGKVLQNLHITDDGAAIVGVPKEEYESLGATRKDLNGVVDIINSMPEARYSVMLSEDDRGNVKASLRTRKEDVDVKALAEKFGGGGHVKASGFTIPKGKLKKEVKWKIVTEE